MKHNTISSAWLCIFTQKDTQALEIAPYRSKFQTLSIANNNIQSEIQLQLRQGVHISTLV